MESEKHGESAITDATTGILVRITNKRDVGYGDTGVIVSGESERLYRVKMDQFYPGEEYRFLFRGEFEVIKNEQGSK